MSDLRYVHRYINGQNFDNFNHFFWTTDVVSADQVETYNITTNSRNLALKDQQAFILPIRTIDENSYELEKPVFKIETNFGTFQNIGASQWVFLKDGKINAIFFEKLLDSNKLILKTSDEYKSFEYESSNYNELTIYFSQMKGKVSNNGSSIKEYCTVSKLERNAPNRFLEEAIELNTVGYTF